MRAPRSSTRAWSHLGLLMIAWLRFPCFYGFLAAPQSTLQYKDVNAPRINCRHNLNSVCRVNSCVHITNPPQLVSINYSKFHWAEPSKFIVLFLFYFNSCHKRRRLHCYVYNGRVRLTLFRETSINAHFQRNAEHTLAGAKSVVVPRPLHRFRSHTSAFNVGWLRLFSQKCATSFAAWQLQDRCLEAKSEIWAVPIFSRGE